MLYYGYIRQNFCLFGIYATCYGALEMNEIHFCNILFDLLDKADSWNANALCLM